jgi:hypothetical protein
MSVIKDALSNENIIKVIKHLQTFGQADINAENTDNATIYDLIASEIDDPNHPVLQAIIEMGGESGYYRMMTESQPEHEYERGMRDYLHHGHTIPTDGIGPTTAMIPQPEVDDEIFKDTII